MHKKIRSNIHCIATFFAIMLPLFFLACTKREQPLAQSQNAYTRDFGKNFRPEYFSMPGSLFLGFLKKEAARPNSTHTSDLLVVYIEGDFKSLVVPEASEAPASSPQPLPYNVPAFAPTAFVLSMQDPRPNVLYLARPGQFEATPLPRSAYVGPARYSQEVTQYLNRSLDLIKGRYGFKSLSLVGYSGGGALAVIIAEERKDVQSLVTVAGVLDTTWWTNKLGVSPLSLSINPADKAQVIANLPQTHFYAKYDDIVPSDMPAHFESLTTFKHFRKILIHGTDEGYGGYGGHWGPWKNNWKEMLKEFI